MEKYWKGKYISILAIVDRIGELFSEYCIGAKMSGRFSISQLLEIYF